MQSDRADRTRIGAVNNTVARAGRTQTGLYSVIIAESHE